MRLLRGLLVLINVRWAIAARARGDRLFAEAEAAYAESLRRFALAEALAEALAGRSRRPVRG